MKKIILVTGAYGFIGRHVAQYYKSMGCIVIGMGHGKWNKTEFSLWGIDSWYECDITIETLLKYAEGVDFIIHCAGTGSIGFSIDYPMVNFEKTVCTTQFILEYIKNFSKNTRLIYLSSAAVYGITNQLPIKENSQLNPISPYGIHKKMAEALCEMYSQYYGVSIIIMRLFSVYGEGLKKQLIWDACKKIESNENVFFGTGTESRDWIHVKEVSKLIYMAHEKITDGCNIVNVASGEPMTIYDILNSIYHNFSIHSKPQFDGFVQIGNPAHYVADISKILQWGWKNQISLTDGIKKYVEWYKSYGEN